LVDLAKSLVGVEDDRLDADPWLLNVENGTVDLRTGRRRNHDPRDLLTKLAPVRADRVPSVRGSKNSLSASPNVWLQSFLQYARCKLSAHCRYTIKFVKALDKYWPKLAPIKEPHLKHLLLPLGTLSYQP
jgi:D5 N terminal like